MNPAPLSWLGIIRLGFVQTALGAIVVLTTSALNRVMVVELALPATLRGSLLGCITRCKCCARAWVMGLTWVGGARLGSLAAWRCWRLAAFLLRRARR